MRNVRGIAIATMFAVMAASASAQSRQNAYEMVTTREGPNASCYADVMPFS